MKKSLVLYFFMVAVAVLYATVATAQHFISVQSADNFSFSVNINGAKFSSSKSGMFRVSNLSAGTYKLSISFPDNKYPPQTFSCLMGKEDESYSLKNLGQDGWVLKNIKNGQVVQPSEDLWDDEPEGKAGPRSNGFAQMLAEVANDSELLKPTVWVYTNKLDGEPDSSDAVSGTQSPRDTGNYEAATKGVVKVSEDSVAGGKALVFYEFNASGGDTVHVIIPSAETAGNTTRDTSGVAKNNIAGDSTINKQTAGNNVAYNQGDDSSVMGRGHRKPAVDTAAAIDTSSNRPFVNPFFNMKDSGTALPPVSAPAADTTALAPLQGTTQPVDTVPQKRPALTTAVSDTAIQKNVNTGTLVDTAAQKTTVTDTPPTDVSLQKRTNIITPQADTSQQKPPGDTAAHVLYVRGDCNNMLTDNAAEKLKDKIYLESDETKMVDIAKKYLNGKCITTEQVKTLANFFLSDDSRLNFFKAVYPFVYDFGNFGSLESYMIDKSYKEMFRAILK